MKVSPWLVLVLVFVAMLSFGVANEPALPSNVGTLSELFNVGDYIGLYKSSKLDGYDILLCTDEDIVKAEETYKNLDDKSKQQREAREKLRGTRDRPAQLEAIRQLQGYRDPISRPICRVFRIGTDFIGVVELEHTTEQYIPISKIIRVRRKIALNE